MENTSYYQHGNNRASGVSNLFSSIAPKYDFINDFQSFFLHRYWKFVTVNSLKPRFGQSALDICCGTGDVTELLASRGLIATGVDFNQPMLDVANERIPQFSSIHSNRPPTYALADALNLPFSDNSFDCVTMCYGLRNLASFDQGIAELVRVLKPGGRLAILDFGRPVNPLLKKLYFDYLSLMVPLIGQIFARDKYAYAYILESLKNYPNPDTISNLLSQNGAHSISLTPFLNGTMTLHSASKSPN